MNIKYLVVFAYLATLTGCATSLYSNDRLLSDTAGTLGLSPGDITIQDRRSSGATTYYIAKTKSGSYACSTICGSAMNFGMSCPPSCNKMENGKPTEYPKVQQLGQ
jgi:hypothetical protein